MAGTFDFWDNPESSNPKSNPKSKPKGKSSKPVRAPLDMRTRKQLPGLPGFAQGIASGLGDLGRGYLNRTGESVDFVTGQEVGTTRYGDMLFGPDGRPGQPKRSRQYGRPSEDFRDRRPDIDPDAVPEEEAMSFADYLRMAEQYAGGSGGGSGVDYSAPPLPRPRPPAEGDAKIAAMFRALGNAIQEDGKSIGANYDTAAATVNANGQQAQTSINAGYQEARNDQSQQLAALGIQDAAAVLASQGGSAASDQAQAQAAAAQNQQINAQQTAGNKAAAVNYNTGVGNAAQLEASTQRAGLQQQLANKLAELDIQEQQDAAEASQRASGDRGNVLSMAMSLAGNADMVDPVVQRRMAAQQDFDNQARAGELELKRIKAMGSERTLSDSLSERGGGYAQMQQMAKAAGIDPTDPEAFTQFLKQFSYIK